MNTQTEKQPKKNNQAVATKSTDTGVSTDVMEFGAFGTENVITQDLRFPKILLMQAMSQWVNDGTFRTGDLVDSFEKIKLGDAKTPLQIIPFENLNVWRIKKMVNGKFETTGYEDRISAEARLDREFTHPDGAKGLREKTFNLFCLIKKGNLKVPYQVSFTNFSFKHAAQSYLNKLQVLKAEGRSPAHVVWNLGVLTEKNEKGSFPVFTLEVQKDENGKDVTNAYEEVKAAYEQFKQMNESLKAGAKVSMDGSDDQVETKDNF